MSGTVAITVHLPWSITPQTTHFSDTLQQFKLLPFIMIVRLENLVLVIGNPFPYKYSVGGYYVISDIYNIPPSLCRGNIFFPFFSEP